MESVLDLLFPKVCSICKRKGNYLCDTCKKLFKRNLPECYVCRSISPNFRTHLPCRNNYSLDHIFVSWEYNSLSSDLLKKYKYNYVYDISPVLSEFFLESILNSNFRDVLKNSLITNIPISSNRLRERGFNQTYDLAKSLSNNLNLDFSPNLLGRKNTEEHQALKDKDERSKISKNDFFIQEVLDISSYQSITIIDDVITTASTLESVSKVLKNHYGKELAINAACMFRGRPYFSSSSEGISS